MKATIESVQLDPRQKSANVALSGENGVYIRLIGLPFDPPTGLPYERAEDLAAKEAVRLLNDVRSE